MQQSTLDHQITSVLSVLFFCINCIRTGLHYQDTPSSDIVDGRKTTLLNFDSPHENNIQTRMLSDQTFYDYIVLFFCSKN